MMTQGLCSGAYGAFSGGLAIVLDTKGQYFIIDKTGKKLVKIA